MRKAFSHTKFTLRVPQLMYAVLFNNARKNGRTLAEEIVSRLRYTIDVDPEDYELWNKV